MTPWKQFRICFVGVAFIIIAPLFVGHFTSEEDAARAYDCAAVVQAYGPGAERNFPGETISEPPVAFIERGAEAAKSSRFISVFWDKGSSSSPLSHTQRCVYLTDPQTKLG
jgi:hypothetical protein